MSLKWFHVLFITVSLALTVILAIWAVQNKDWVITTVAIAAAAALIVYRGAFQKKARELGLK